MGTRAARRLFRAHQTRLAHVICVAPAQICVHRTQMCVASPQLCAYHAQMGEPKYKTTVATLCDITGYSRDRLNGLLKELPGFAGRAKAARVAVEYSGRDVLVVAICCELERKFGLQRAAVASLADVILRTVSSPRPVARSARLVLNLVPPAASYFDGPVLTEEGLVLPLGPIFERVDGCLPSSWVKQINRTEEMNIPAVVGGTESMAQAVVEPPQPRAVRKEPLNKKTGAA